MIVCLSGHLAGPTVLHGVWSVGTAPIAHPINDAIEGQGDLVVTTYYVSNTSANGIGVGNDQTGTGSETSPFLTLDKALAVVQPGDSPRRGDWQVHG